MNPKCLVDVILCAWPPSYTKSLARKQYSNAVIGTRYPNAVIWLVRDKNPNAAIWLVRDTCTYPNVTIFSDGGNTTLYTDLKFFSYKKKKNSKMRLRQYFHIILDFELRCPTNWKFQEIGRKAWLCARFICEKRPPHKGSSMPKHPVCGKEWEKG